MAALVEMDRGNKVCGLTIYARDWWIKRNCCLTRLTGWGASTLEWLLKSWNACRQTLPVPTMPLMKIEWVSANPEGWGEAINLIHNLVTKQDVKMLAHYCKSGSDKYFQSDSDYNLCKNWKSAFRGESKYYQIRYGISGRKSWKREESNPFDPFEREDNNTGGENFLAFHQWNGYQAWLSLHPTEYENFHWFKVSVYLLITKQVFYIVN